MMWRCWRGRCGRVGSGLRRAVAVTGVAFSADGLVLATSGDDKLVQTWSAESGVAMEEYRAGGAIGSLVFAGGMVGVGLEKSIVEWDTKTAWVLDKKLPLAGQ